jgi:acetyltransferase-like isoleucine patch superfamily enzyme
MNATLKTRFYRFVLRRPAAPPPSPIVDWFGLLHYFWLRGGTALLRGALSRFRLRSAGKRFLLGQRCTLMFARGLSVGHHVSIGHDSMINALSHEGFSIGNNVSIREYAWMQATSMLDNPGVGLVIGDDAYLGPRCLIGAGGGVRIGARVRFGASVHILAENHEFRDRDLPVAAQGVTRRGIVIEDDVWMGNSVIVLDGAWIGKGAVIGAGAVVTKPIPPYSIAVGNPARVIGVRTSRENSPHEVPIEALTVAH